MNITHESGRGLVFSQIPAELFQLLQQIPVHADSSGFAPGEQRLFQSPIETPDNGEDEEFNNDWREHVLPDMVTEFTHQLDVVSGDLKQATRFTDRGGDESFAFVIPTAHIERWYGAINQARLVMQERYRFPQVDSPEAMDAMMKSDHFGPYLTSRFYTDVQGILLTVMTGEGE